MKIKEVIILILLAATLFAISQMGIEKIDFGKDENTTFESDFDVNAAVSEEEEEALATEDVTIAEEVIDNLKEFMGPEDMNILIVGLDKSQVLADVNIIAHIDAEDESVKLISLPRDLYIDFREEGFSEIKSANDKISVDYCKLTEVYYNAGKGKEALTSMKAIASEISGLEVDHYVAVNTYGFVDLVDVVGGVEFDVPVRMAYTDPYQDLYIDLYPGLQLLDGEKAEQLVRFRKYGGDVPPDKQRMKTQQDFLSAMANQILEVRSFKTLKDLATTGYEMVNTDVGLIDSFEYIQFAVDSDIEALLENKDMVILPSEGKRMGDLNLWYEEWDHQGVRDFIHDELDL